MVKKINIFEQKINKNNVLQPEYLDVPEDKEQERVGQKMIPAGTIRNRHLEFGLYAVQVSDTRPNTGVEYAFHFNTATGVFSAWNGSAWLTTTLT